MWAQEAGEQSKLQATVLRSACQGQSQFKAHQMLWKISLPSMAFGSWPWLPTLSAAAEAYWKRLKIHQIAFWHYFFHVSNCLICHFVLWVVHDHNYWYVVNAGQELGDSRVDARAVSKYNLEMKELYKEKWRVRLSSCYWPQCANAKRDGVERKEKQRSIYFKT